MSYVGFPYTDICIGTRCNLDLHDMSINLLVSSDIIVFTTAIRPRASSRTIICITVVLGGFGITKPDSQALNEFLILVAN